MPPQTTVVVTGAAGQVGREVVARFGRIPRTTVTGLTHADCDTGDFDAVMQRVVPLAPDVIVNAGAYTDVDGCEAAPDRAFLANGLAVRHLRLAAEVAGADLVHISTDYVFDGTASRPYREWDEPRPRSVYGASKLAGEREALLYRRAFVVRTSWVLGGGRNFVRAVRSRALAGLPLTVVDDQRGRPTLAADLADALALLWRSRRYGLWHVANAGDVTWHEVAVWAMARSGLAVDVMRGTTADLGRPAPRPANSVLDDHLWLASGFPPMRDWRDALDEHWDTVSEASG